MVSSVGSFIVVFPSAVAAEPSEVLPEGATGNTPAQEGCVLVTPTQHGHL